MKVARIIVMLFIIAVIVSCPAFSDVLFHDITASSGLGNHREYGWGTAMPDYNYDGQVDILIAGQFGGNRFYRNNGDLTFTEVTHELNIDEGELLRRRVRGYGRGLLMEMLYRNGGMNQREIGDLMGMDYSAVSVGRKRFQMLQEKDKRLKTKIERIKLRLSQE